MQPLQPVVAPTFGQFWASLVDHLRKNLPTTVLFAVVGAVVSWTVNVYWIAKRYQGTNVPNGAPVTTGGNMMWGLAFWILASTLVFSLFGHWRSVGTEQFFLDVKGFPQTVTGIFRQDGSLVWSHLLWGFAGSLVLTQVLSPSLRGMFGMTVMLTIPSVLGRVVLGYVSRVWSATAARINPARGIKAVPLVAPAVAGFGASAAMMLGFLIDDTTVELVLALAAAAGAFIIHQQGRGGGPDTRTLMALLWVVVVVLGAFGGAQAAVADDGGYAECGYSWSDWWACDGSDDVRTDALAGALAGGLGGGLGSGLGPAIASAARGGGGGGVGQSGGRGPAVGSEPDPNWPAPGEGNGGSMTLESENADGTTTRVDVAPDGTETTTIYDPDGIIISQTITPPLQPESSVIEVDNGDGTTTRVETAPDGTQTSTVVGPEGNEVPGAQPSGGPPDWLQGTTEPEGAQAPPGGAEAGAPGGSTPTEGQPGAGGSEASQPAWWGGDEGSGSEPPQDPGSTEAEDGPPEEGDDPSAEDAGESGEGDGQPGTEPGDATASSTRNDQDGSVTETVAYPDGSSRSTTIEPNGTITTVVTDPSGNTTTTIDRPIHPPGGQPDPANADPAAAARREFERRQELLERLLRERAALAGMDQDSMSTLTTDFWDSAATWFNPPPVTLPSGPSFDELLRNGDPLAADLERLAGEIGDGVPTDEQLDAMRDLSDRIQAEHSSQGSRVARANVDAAMLAEAGEVVAQVGAAAGQAAAEGLLIGRGWSPSAARAATGAVFGALQHADRDAAGVAAHAAAGALSNVLGGKAGDLGGQATTIAGRAAQGFVGGVVGGGAGAAGEQLADGKEVTPEAVARGAALGGTVGAVMGPVGGAAADEMAAAADDVGRAIDAPSSSSAPDGPPPVSTAPDGPATQPVVDGPPSGSVADDLAPPPLVPDGDAAPAPLGSEGPAGHEPGAMPVGEGPPGVEGTPTVQGEPPRIVPEEGTPPLSFPPEPTGPGSGGIDLGDMVPATGIDPGSMDLGDLPPGAMPSLPDDLAPASLPDGGGADAPARPLGDDVQAGPAASGEGQVAGQSTAAPPLDDVDVALDAQRAEVSGLDTDLAALQAQGQQLSPGDPGFDEWLGEFNQASADRTAAADRLGRQLDGVDPVDTPGGQVYVADGTIRNHPWRNDLSPDPLGRPLVPQDQASNCVFASVCTATGVDLAEVQAAGRQVLFGADVDAGVPPARLREVLDAVGADPQPVDLGQIEALNDPVILAGRGHAMVLDGTFRDAAGQLRLRIYDPSGGVFTPTFADATGWIDWSNSFSVSGG